MTVSAPLKQAPSTQSKAVSKGNRFFAVLQIIAWQMIALLVVEGVLYWAGMGEEDIYKLDRTIGFKHFPNKRVTWRSEGFSQSYFDADGMRDPGLTLEKPAGVYRVALLGDSMVEGLQVPVEQTFGQLVEKQINKDSASIDKNIQVVNFANSGYSTAQEYLELKEKVFKYHPDLVVLGYMSRDMFENWSPPDQTITNVRPYALHLPGRNLVIDNSPVINWMKSPRAKFLMQIEFLRHHSRIWGLISAAETQLSYQDPIYRGIVALCTKPGKTIRQWTKDLQEAAKHPPTFKDLAKFAAPSFNINFFEAGGQKPAELVQSSINHAPQSMPHVRFVVAPQLSQQKSAPSAGGQAAAMGARFRQEQQADSDRAGNENLNSANASEKSRTNSSSAAADTTAAATTPATAGTASAPAANGNGVYVKLMARTMHSLIAEMQSMCLAHDARLAVLVMPSRAQLCPARGMEANFYNITYADEINIIEQICAEEHLPMFNAETSFEKIFAKERPSMFYLMHMNAKGHKALAAPLSGFLTEQMKADK